MISNPPIFIVGMQRSGTTFLRLLLNRLPELYIPFESEFLEVAHKFKNEDFSNIDNKIRFIECLTEEPFTKKGKLSFSFEQKEQLDEVRNIPELLDLFFSHNAKKQGKVRWGIKNPGDQTRIHDLLSLFPSAKIIAVTRDPRGIFLSQKAISWGVKDPVKLAYLWNESQLSVSIMKSMKPASVEVIRYEDLILDVEEVARKLCKFIEVDFSSNLLDFDKNGSNMPDKSKQWHSSSMGAPDKEKVFSWREKLNTGTQSLFQSICREQLIQGGYELTTINLSYLEKLKKKILVMRYY